MSRYERGFHPLKKLENTEVPKVSFDVGLPVWVETDNIGVNVRKIHDMMQMGGIANLEVVGTSGETSSYEPTIVGHANDGTAFGGNKVVEKKVPIVSVEMNLTDESRNKVFMQTRWSDVKLNINLNEATKRIEDNDQPLRSTRAWSEELDSAVKKGLAAAGSEGVAFGTIEDLYQFGASEMLAINLPPFEHTNLAEHTGKLLVAHFALNVASRIASHKNGDPEDFRWSVFAGPQFDRALILQSMSKVGKTVKDIAPKEKK